LNVDGVVRRAGDRSHSAKEPRQKAETLFSSEPEPAEAGPDTKAFAHELGVHRIELEVQNEQLRQAQLEVETSRDRYVELYDNAPVGYVTIDANAAIVACNLTAAKLLGRDRRSLLGVKLPSFMSHSDADAFQRQRMQVSRLGSKQSFEVNLLRADGRPFRARLDSVPDASGDGRCNVALIDLTELRDAQADRQATEARFQLIAANIEDVFYLRDLDGVVSYVSPSYERIWGRPASELAGRTTAWLDSVVAEDREQVMSAWQRLRAGSPISEVYRIRRPDGALRWVQSRGFPILEDDGSWRSVGVVRDVTQERMLEQALRQAQKMEAVGTLASGIAHNLRNVLQAILNFTQVIRIGAAAGKPIFETLDRVSSATQRGAVMIEQLMTFARKQEAVGLSPVRLDDVLRDAEALLKQMLGAGIALTIDAGAPNDVVMADAVQLEQILLNLAANARDAMPAGGTLTMTSREAVLDERVARAHGVSPGRHVVLTVKDTGDGMDAATKARVFEPFFTTKDIGKGTGLGLSTAYAVVRHFSGDIEIDSAPGAGATFTIRLPAVSP
jgi:PAS domain S-box-containing protein